MKELARIDEVLYEIPATAQSGMRVPARVYANSEQIEAIQRDRSLEQLMNVATLPGIVDFSLAMPDIHQGYGFPVGGIAATELPGGVVSPGGVGYDINCGVRLLATGMSLDKVGDRLEPLVHEMSRRVPAGAGRRAELRLSQKQLERVLEDGSPALISEFGLGTEADLDHTESGGVIAGADATCVSEHAKQRGHDQIGTLGSGNHFIEVQRVDTVLDGNAAQAFGLVAGMVCVLIHSGSRGLGHQVCTDYVKLHDAGLKNWGIELPDRQLACAPLSSDEGRRYLAAMQAAANFAWANRQAIAHRVRQAFERVFGGAAAAQIKQVYDVAHNIAKVERYGGRELCVHRKGATRAFGPSSEEIPDDYRGTGQPVFIPGSMGTSSFVLAGCDAAAEHSFATVCHGAGRMMSRTQARKRIHGKELRRELGKSGIVVRCPSNRGLAEEAPFAYKDVEGVVEVVSRAGLALPVAQLKPLGVVKG